MGKGKLFKKLNPSLKGKTDKSASKYRYETYNKEED